LSEKNTDVIHCEKNNIKEVGK